MEQLRREAAKSTRLS